MSAPAAIATGDLALDIEFALGECRALAREAGGREAITPRRVQGSVPGTTFATGVVWYVLADRAAAVTRSLLAHRVGVEDSVACGRVRRAIGCVFFLLTRAPAPVLEKARRVDLVSAMHTLDSGYVTLRALAVWLTPDLRCAQYAQASVRLIAALPGVRA
ncbi:MAG: hypothetical protein Q7V62_12570, partial [Actinomycetota bacterium]|nr:hypothetical protein [Actinomycetota bacterium]